MVFAPHAQLAADTTAVVDLPLCSVLLMKNAAFPWLILVPRVENARELFDLSLGQYSGVMEEVRKVAEIFAGLTGADKMNVAALGNMVPQLHIHIIARFKSDAAWPNPVWNSGTEARNYSPEELITLVRRIKESLQAITNL